jgi:hypothetical protein
VAAWITAPDITARGITHVAIARPTILRRLMLDLFACPF